MSPMSPRAGFVELVVGLFGVEGCGGVFFGEVGTFVMSII